MLHDGGTVEDGIHLEVLIEVLRHIAKDDVQSLTKQFLEGVCEVVEQQGSQAALCFLLRLAAHQAIDVLGIRVNQFAQDVDTQITCSTCDQHIAQLLALTRTEEPEGITLQEVVDGGIVEVSHFIRSIADHLTGNQTSQLRRCRRTLSLYRWQEPRKPK